MRPLLLTFLIWLSLPFIYSQKSLDSYNYDQQMEFYNVPVVSVAYYSENDVKRLYKGDLQEDSLFPAGSMSKIFTAIGLLTLVESGKVDLDVDVNTYLKEWKVPDGLTTHYRDVTLRLLLSHMSGIDDTAKKQLPERIEYYPGLKRRYSWSGYYIIQKVIEDVTGESFRNYMQLAVLEPLGMDRSFFRDTPNTVENAVQGYNLFGEPVEDTYYENMGAMGLWTTPEDVISFMQNIEALLDGSGEGPLSKDGLELFLSYQDGGWGLGPSLKFNGSDKIYRHSGFSRGFVHYFIARPYRGDGVVIMCSGENAWKVIMELLHGFEDYNSWGL